MVNWFVLEKFSNAMPPEKENTLAIDKKEMTKNMRAELGDIYMRPGQTQNLYLPLMPVWVRPGLM